VDFGRLGLVPDGERRRSATGSSFTAVFSRHQFVWPTFTQTTEDVHLWLRGRLAVLRRSVPGRNPDNMASIVTKAENTAPRFNDTVLRVRPVEGLCHRRGPRRHPDRQAEGGTRRLLRPEELFAGESFIGPCRLP